MPTLPFKWAHIYTMPMPLFKRNGIVCTEFYAPKKIFDRTLCLLHLLRDVVKCLFCFSIKWTNKRSNLLFLLLTKERYCLNLFYKLHFVTQKIIRYNAKGSNLALKQLETGVFISLTFWSTKVNIKKGFLSQQRVYNQQLKHL